MNRVSVVNFRHGKNVATAKDPINDNNQLSLLDYEKKIEDIDHHRESVMQLIADYTSKTGVKCNIFSFYIKRAIRYRFFTIIINKVFKSKGEQFTSKKSLFADIIDTIITAKTDMAQCAPAYELLKFCPDEISDTDIIQLFHQAHKKIHKKEQAWQAASQMTRVDSLYWNTLFGYKSMELRFNYIIERDVISSLRKHYPLYSNLSEHEKESVNKFIRFLVRMPDNLYYRSKAATRLIGLEDKIEHKLATFRKGTNIKFVISRAHLLYDHTIWETINDTAITIKTHSSSESNELPYANQDTLSHLILRIQNHHPALTQKCIYEKSRTDGCRTTLAGEMALWEDDEVSILFCHTSKRLIVMTFTGHINLRKRFIKTYSAAANIEFYSQAKIVPQLENDNRENTGAVISLKNF